MDGPDPVDLPEDHDVGTGQRGSGDLPVHGPALGVVQAAGWP
jgi:hypothetical protein